MSDDAIISPDTRRLERLPPRQALTRKWPVLHAGEVPPFDPAAWDFTIFPRPLVSEVKRFTWSEFSALPRVKVFADMHCVTRWSKLDNLWEGVPTRELLKHVQLSPEANFVMVDTGRDVKPLLAAMRGKGVHVGRLFPALPQHMRVTIGRPDEMERFVETLKQVM